MAAVLRPLRARIWARSKLPTLEPTGARGIIRRVLRSALGEIVGVARARTETHRKLRDRLTFVLVATAGVDIVCAVLAYLFEHDAKQTQVKSIGSALFWTTTQLLTVSSSLQNPISPGGRVLDVGMEAYAIVVIATLAGALGTFLQKRGEEDAQRKAAGTDR